MNASNRLHLSYAQESAKFLATSPGIIDIHSHIQGEVATTLYAQAAHHYGVTTTYSMTPLNEIPVVRNLMGDAINFIAIPQFGSKDPTASFGKEFIRSLPEFKSYGAKIAKFWSAPRIYEASSEPFHRNPFRINSALRVESIAAAVDLGMICMAHIADPDTWFTAKYQDSARYGTKLQQYELFEEVLSQFQVPWIAAHMGGYPENLTFLSGLLSRHPNLYLDCSATKWIVRELGKHPLDETRTFFTQWRGRILFGSDIVARDSHVSATINTSEMDAKANNHEEAYDLYASRYWVLRTLFESSYNGESPISDPDLHMVDSARFTPSDAPTLRGIQLDKHTLASLYSGAASTLLS